MKKLTLVFILAFIVGIANSKDNSIPLIGSKAPSFKAESTNGKITFPDDFGKSWKILFSHPQDFTPVCSSELLELAYLQPEFDRLNVKIAVISTDGVEQHKLWKEYMQELDYKGRGTQKIDFPIIDDSKASVSKTYGMLHEPASSNKDIRGVFIIDPDNNICSVNFYPMQVGRNMDEVVRTIEALQRTSQETVFTPANWEEGDDVLVPFYPYTKEQLTENPKLKEQYYNLGNRMWFKKADK